jgi:photosystem II Psb28-2 protein
MADVTPSIQFFESISEDLSGISFRRNRSTGVRSILMTFRSLRSIERFQSYTNRFAGGMLLNDSEGNINIEPASVRFVFGGPEGDDLERVECVLEVDREDHWERLMRFVQRYAEANDMIYGESRKE